MIGVKKKELSDRTLAEGEEVPIEYVLDGNPVTVIYRVDTLPSPAYVGKGTVVIIETGDNGLSREQGLECYDISLLTGKSRTFELRGPVRKEMQYRLGYFKEEIRSCEVQGMNPNNVFPIEGTNQTRNHKTRA